MAITTISSREFNQNSGRAKRAAEQGPVIVTDRGKPSLVVMKFEDYERMSEKRGSLLERLYMPGLEEIDADFEFPRMDLELQIPEFDTEVYADAESPNQKLEPPHSHDSPAVR